MFRLGGLSKTVGLPQVKLGWIALHGPDALVAEALDRLELICDTYLSVSTPVQIGGAGSLLERGAAVRAQILERVRGNYATLRDVVSRRRAAPTVLPADGGWSAVHPRPGDPVGRSAGPRSARARRVVVHPGYFFDFPHEAFLVVSLLPEPDDVRARRASWCRIALDAA